MIVSPTVSGIMIFLDAERFIDEAIESVLGQTYLDWELLLVNDGSTDESTAIAQHYARSYPRQIQYLEHEGHHNKGMSASRNLGIRHAKGKYIAFLDADDVWLPNKLEQQVALIESQPKAAMLYGRTQYWHSWASKHGGHKQDCLTKLRVKTDTMVDPPRPLIFYLHDEQVYPCTCSVLIRREVFENIGMFEEAFHNANEDMVFYTKLFLKSPVFISTRCWDRYRINPGSYWVNYWKVIHKSSRFPHLSQPHPERLRYLDWLTTYLAEIDVHDHNVLRALQKAYWPYRHPRLYSLIAPFRYLTEQAIQYIKRMFPLLVRS
jgi:glycosyltransferase involved in cell wall biosynthesis